KLIADFYHAYMDMDSINAKGLSPIQSTLNNIAAIDSVKSLTEVFGNAWLTGTRSPIYAGLWYNRLDPNQYQLSVGVGGLGLPDRDYYLEDTERFANIRQAYLAHIAQMLSFAKVDNAEQKA
ncbi:M13 family peptidase, partial [Bowmanella dokdonensis]|nr:M13 family peptidase [Bowmanella dokdonensis]